jgi:2,4-dienoyl-CoA reductase-like NADH-dependent reductase (Old Yellow Enzyme family)/thioredoxin reductase
MGSRDALPHVFEPLRVGTLSLDHRLVVPPHGGGNGNLMGTEAEFEQHCALWLAKARGGMQWLGGGPNFVKNPLPVGFEATGVGSHGPGFFRDPRYPERIGELARRVHDAGAYLSVQMVQQGGMPIGPSPTFSGYASHVIAHGLDRDEVHWLVTEYGESAALAIDAGVDAIEIHANHDDVVQWFLSPATNLRDDEYGGTFENRRRYLREICERIRSLAPRPFTFGLRLNLDEMIDGGYGIDGCQRLIEAFTADGTVDYFSVDVGGNWDAPSYIPIPWYEDMQWAELAGQAKQATNLPVVYAGRVTSPDQAEQVLVAGHADLVAMARATMADPDLVNKAAGTDAEPLRPCIGLNECIHRKLIDGLPYACGVNVRFGREAELATAPASASGLPRSVLVVGGGPGGSEFAARCAEQGHHVQLWERNDAIGGALAVAALARGNRSYRRWIDYQQARLDRVGVDVLLGRTATGGDVLAAGADVVLVATGATPRVPSIPGVGGAHVHLAGAVLTGAARLGARVAVIAEDDGPAPLSVTDHLAGSGHDVTLVYQSASPSPLVGKYSNGGMFARLVDGGVQFVPMARVTEIGSGTLHLSSTYGSRSWTLGPFDSVVLVAGAIPDDALYRELKGRHPNLHLLGDAFAPRRMVFATRQAFELARRLGEVHRAR